MSAKKTIIAIHGAGMHAGIWGGMAPHLLDYYLRSINLPGHDGTTAATALTSIDDMAAYVKQKMAGNAPASNILMGHSMGALVALAAADDPSVAAVVMMGAGAEMPVNADLLATARDKPEDAQKLILKWGIYAAHPQLDAVRTIVASVMDSTPKTAIYHDLAACNNFTDGEKRARRLSKPALVIAGAEDRMTRPTGADALSAMLQNGKYEVIDDCGHMIMTEAPIAAASLIRQFLSSKSI